MKTYKHLCPHCMTTLSVDHIDELTMLVQCPICKKQLLLSDHGRSLREAPTITCIKCQHEMVYDGKAEEIVCDKCGEKFKVAKGGACIIETELYEKGQKGELPFTKFPDKVIARKNKARSIVSKCFGYGLWLAILAGIGWIVYKEVTRPIPIENTIAFHQRDSLWTNFRQKNPYNIQLEGIHKYDDGSYTLILSEPSPRLSIDRLNELFEPLNASIIYKTHHIGYDGWLKDIVICFNNIKDKEYPTLEKAVIKALYGTDYKAHFLDLSPTPQYVAFTSNDLNYQISEEELRKWFIEDKEPLFYLEDSTRVTTLESVLSSGKGMRILFSKEPGFVMWILDKGISDISSFRIAARKFSLDSDLILGAIASKDRVAIIGRERCESYLCLPPLRTETISILASTKESELSQSYERTSLFAGKLPGGKDFAPIYLSDELWHTEYGSVLNFTDQMLKSWSENGVIDYIGFDYPKPVNWAFKRGVIKDLQASQLTYNWNTSGLGYIVEDEGYSIYALNRTGSLPVSYIPGDADGLSVSNKVYIAEQNAFDFFSSLSNPMLLRVVQYTALYQIFYNMGIEVTNPYVSCSKYDIPSIPDALVGDSKSIIRELADFDNVGLKIIVSKYNVSLSDKSHVKSYLQYDAYYTLPTGTRVYKERGSSFYECEVFYEKWLRKKCGSEAAVQEFLECCALSESLHKLSSALYPLRGDDVLMDSMAKWYASGSRNVQIKYSPSSKRQYELIPSFDFDVSFDGKDFKFVPKQGKPRSYEDRIKEAQELLHKYYSEIHSYLSLTGYNLKRSRDLIVQYNSNKNHLWIKCPTIVESWWLTDSTTATGGHNINSLVTTFRVADDLKTGAVRSINTEGQRILEISRKDRQTRVADQDYLRRNARLGKSDIKGAAITPRARASVISTSSPRTLRGFNATDHLTINVTKEGHSINGKYYTDLTELLNDVGKFVADGESEVKKIEIQGLKTAGVDVDVYIDGVFGQLRKGSCASIPIDKYDVAHYTVETDGDIATVTIPIKPGIIKFGSTSSVRAEGLGGLTTTTPSIKIKSGEVRFRVPKAQLAAFIQMIKDFISRQKGYWNEFKLKREMKQRGINPADCEEFLQLQVAKNNCIILIKGYKDVWVYSQQAIA